MSANHEASLAPGLPAPFGNVRKCQPKHVTLAHKDTSQLTPSSKSDEDSAERIPSFFRSVRGRQLDWAVPADQTGLESHLVLGLEGPSLVKVSVDSGPVNPRPRRVNGGSENIRWEELGAVMPRESERGVPGNPSGFKMGNTKCAVFNSCPVSQSVYGASCLLPRFARPSLGRVFVSLSFYLLSGPEQWAFEWRSPERLHSAFERCFTTYRESSSRVLAGPCYVGRVRLVVVLQWCWFRLSRAQRLV